MPSLVSSGSQGVPTQDDAVTSVQQPDRSGNTFSNRSNVCSIPSSALNRPTLTWPIHVSVGCRDRMIMSSRCSVLRLKNVVLQPLTWCSGHFCRSPTVSRRARVHLRLWFGVWRDGRIFIQPPVPSLNRGQEHTRYTF